MLILTYSKAKMSQTIHELGYIDGVINLRMKTLKPDNIPEIAGIPCETLAKNLNVPVHIDQNAPKDNCVASIKRNLGHLRWKFHKLL
jgi:hypothetical protein